MNRNTSSFNSTPGVSSIGSRATLDNNVSPLEKLINTLFLFGYFVLLPIFIVIISNWAVYAIAANNFYQDSWMMPVLLMLSVYLAGAFIRQKAADEGGGMGLFLLGIVALGVFAYLTWMDVTSTGGLYSRFMPKLMRASVLDYLYAVPAVGILGMLCFKWFTLKNYG